MKAPNEIPELNQEMIVQAKIVTACFDCGWIDPRTFTRHPQFADIAGDKTHKAKDEDRRTRKGRDHQQDALDCVLIHFSLLPPRAKRQFQILERF